MTIKDCFFKNTCKDYNTSNCNEFCRPFMELYAKPKQVRLSPKNKTLCQLVPRDTTEEQNFVQ